MISDTRPAQHLQASPHYYVSIVIVLIITFWNCRSSSQNYTKAEQIESLARRTLGKNYLIEYNETNVFALCQQNPLADHLRRKYRYIVIRLSDNAIIHEGIFSMGYAKWRDKDSIEVLSLSKDDTTDSNPKQIIHLN